MMKDAELRRGRCGDDCYQRTRYAMVTLMLRLVDEDYIVDQRRNDFLQRVSNLRSGRGFLSDSELASGRGYPSDADLAARGKTPKPAARGGKSSPIEGLGLSPEDRQELEDLLG